MFKKLIDFALNRFKEPSTWAGIVLAVAGAMGVTLDAEVQMQIASVLAAIVGIVLTLYKQKNSPDRKSTGIPDPSIPDAAVVRDPDDDEVQSVDLTKHRQGGAREKWSHRNEQ